MPNQEMENLMHNIKWLRNHYGISREKMARHVGINVRTLEKIEKGIVPKLRLDTVFNIYRHFGIHPKDQFEKRLGSE